MMDLQPVTGNADIEVHSYISLASQSIYRGVADSPRSPVASAALDISIASGWFLDGWIGKIARYRPFADEHYASATSAWPQDLPVGDAPTKDVIQADIDAGYGFAVSPQWQAAISHAWLRHNALYQNNNYQEWRVYGAYRSLLSLQLAYADDYRQSGSRYWNTDAQLQYPLDKSLILQGALGQTLGLVPGESEHKHPYGWVGVAWQAAPFLVTLRAHHATNLEDFKTTHRLELQLTWGSG